MAFMLRRLLVLVALLLASVTMAADDSPFVCEVTRPVSDVDLLRTTLDREMPAEIPLSDELGYLSRFVDIELVRFGDRLRVTWDIDPDVRSALVPPLILQPLVENAIRHGIAISSRGGRLEITAARADGDLWLEVRDNGPGLGGSDEKPGNGIGIENTRTRLERLYGTRASFRLTNDHGLVVSMTLPWSG
jgi:LytS/YehU family sensor histidine kinase